MLAIDIILQRRIEQAGVSNLHVNIQSNQVGLKIRVNGKSYAAVHEIKDEVVRSLIQAAIEEWQASAK